MSERLPGDSSFKNRFLLGVGTAIAAVTLYETHFWEDPRVRDIEGVLPANRFFNKAESVLCQNLVFESFTFKNQEYGIEVKNLHENGYQVVLAVRHRSHLDHAALDKACEMIGLEHPVLFAGNTMMWHPLRHDHSKIPIPQGKDLPKDRVKRQSVVDKIKEEKGKSVEVAKLVVSRNIPLGIYLEGGREKEKNELMRMHGSGMDYVNVSWDEQGRSNIVVLVLTINGTQEALPPSTFVLHRKPIEVIAAEPIFLADIAHLSRQVQADIIGFRIASMVPDAEKGPYGNCDLYQTTREKAAAAGIMI